MRHGKSFMFSVSALALMGVSATAMAQTAPPAPAARADTSTIEDVVVTATKTGSTSVQKTPLAVTAFTASQLEDSNIVGTESLAKYAPDVQVAQNNGYAEFYIRGVGSNNVFNGSDPDVTVNIDGVYIGRPFGQFTDFLDVARVEVLRGPQGTLYGRNAVGGTINVISRTPTDETEEKVRISGGNYAEFSADGYMSGAIEPGKIDASASLSYYRHDPYIENIIPGRPGANDADRGSARFQIRLRPTDTIDAITRLDYSVADEATEGTPVLLQPYDAVTNSILGNYHKIALNGPITDFTRTAGVAEDVTYSISDALKLRSITAYRVDTYHLHSDTDDTDLGYQLTDLKEQEHQFSQEVNLNGSLAQVDFVGGLYYFHEADQSTSSVRSTKTALLTAYYPLSNDDTYAVFANANYHLTDKLTLIGGARYTIEDKTFAQYGGAFSLTTGLNKDLPGAGYPVGGPSTYNLSMRNFATTPKGGVEYQIDDNVMAYASVTRGFKSGGFNMTVLPANASTQLVGFAPEKLWSYEGGAKTQWLDNRVRFNATAFYYDYTNLQVLAFLVPGQTSITNAATATVKGLEFELETKPFKPVDIGMNLSFLDAKYASYPNAPSTGTATINASGHYLNEAPTVSLNSWAQYIWDLQSQDRITFRAEYSWQAREYFTVVNDSLQTQRAFGILNLLTSWSLPDAQWSIAAYGKNLLDQQYITQSGSSGAVPAGHAGDPRTFGVSITWQL